MRLAIIRRLYSDFGGAEIFINRLISQLNLEDVSIISNKWTTSNQPTKFIHADQSGLTRKSRLIRFNQSVSEILRKENFDITQSHERMCGIDIFRAGDGVHASWLEKLSRESGHTKKFWLKHDPYHQEVLRLEKLMAQDSRITFVANSTMTKNDLINYLNLPQDRIVTIKNGFDNSQIKLPTPQEKLTSKLKLGINPDLPFILFVGSGFERKGAHLLVKTAEISPDIQIGIVGKDKRLDKLKTIIHQKKLENRVFIYGPQKDIAQYYQAADIFCLPSLYDSFSNAVLEALAYGLPCVLTENVGMHDAVNLFYAGTSCQRNFESIADAIRLAINNKTQLSTNALALSKKYSNENSSKAWADLYQSIMNAKTK